MGERLTPLARGPVTALVLSGGGARGAYEVGVVSYLLEEFAEEYPRELSFDVLCGTSIGALNVCCLAAFADRPRDRARELISLWREVTTKDVLTFGVFDALKLARESLGRRPEHPSAGDGERRMGLIDTRPLQALLLRRIPWPQIGRNLRAGRLHALSVSATHVGTGRTTVFVQTADGQLPYWSEDPNISAVPARISPRHALASSAIPLLFRPVHIGGELFADGGLRLNVPLHPALRLGADRLVVISLRAQKKELDARAAQSTLTKQDEASLPSAAFLAGKVMNAVMQESVEHDLTRLARINAMLEAGARAYGPRFAATINRSLASMGHPPLRHVNTMLIRPSRALGALAAEYVATGFKPRTLASRTLRALAEREAPDEADLVSYLLFDPGFAEQLIDLGRRDARDRHDDWVRFWRDQPPSTWEQVHRV